MIVTKEKFSFVPLDFIQFFKKCRDLIILKCIVFQKLIYVAALFEIIDAICFCLSHLPGVNLLSFFEIKYSPLHLNNNGSSNRIIANLTL